MKQESARAPHNRPDPALGGGRGAPVLAGHGARERGGRERDGREGR